MRNGEQGKRHGGTVAASFNGDPGQRTPAIPTEKQKLLASGFVWVAGSRRRTLVRQAACGADAPSHVRATHKKPEAPKKPPPRADQVLVYLKIAGCEFHQDRNDSGGQRPAAVTKN
jgi:hypothetical protein